MERLSPTSISSAAAALFVLQQQHVSISLRSVVARSARGERSDRERESERSPGGSRTRRQ